MAVEYEQCEAAIRSFQQAGVRILKAQVTAGLEVAFDGSDRDAEALAALDSFAEGVYLHQVVERRDGEVRRYLDLPEALEEWKSGGVPDDCRVHFHVPVFKSDFGPFGGTQSYVGEFLELVRREPITPHLELETYTWDVLPPAHRRESIVDAIAGELQWALGRLRG
jgi:hypothetical protein